MTAPSHYFEGLLAAVRPHEQRAFAPSPTEPPQPTETSPSAADENFSWEELAKRRLHPLESFGRLLDCVAANRPPDRDDQFRFQWFGLFYQAPAQDAFTLRLRLPGGRIKPWQFAGLADLTQRHASGQVQCNAQGGLDVPGVPVTSVIDALVQAESIGFNPRRTGGDCVRAIRGGELDGVLDHPEECVPYYPLVCALEQACSASPALSDLPLPCEIVFARKDENISTQRQSGAATIILRPSTRAGTSEKGRSAVPESSFILHLPDDTHGFRLAPSQVVPACLELLKSWASRADRSNRDAASLYKFAAVVGLDTLNTLPGGTRREPLPSGPKPSSAHPGTPIGYLMPEGRLLSGQLTTLGQCCQTHGWREIRLLRSQLFAVGPRGEILDVTAVLREVLFA